MLHLFDKKYNSFLFLFILKITIYFCEGKAEFSAAITYSLKSFLYEKILLTQAFKW